MVDEENQGQQQASYNPGAVIVPGVAGPVSPQPQQVTQVAPAPEVEQPVVAPQQVPVTQMQPPVPEQPQVQSQGTQDDEEQVEPEDEDSDGDELAWSAPEFIAHPKNVSWYFGVTLGAIALAALFYYLTRSYVSVGVTLVAAVLIQIYGSHEPQQIQYILDSYGITIGKRQFSYGDFLSFTITPEVGFSSITLMPARRFSPPASLYYHPADQARIVAFLADRVPLEQRRADAVDTFMKRIRY